ncbi:hypothetical protein UFOVP83_41 [uncultured Caudovirales phage]|uniref:Uncharacterized protein n=1 Tax=uncultured Caudovirales phage TaxID=2100421 RepID=A0A6J5TBC9_9CAUD|nr:hypothetical protein UFOVP83_41 [uncultured Caudovirales phage]
MFLDWLSSTQGVLTLEATLLTIIVLFAAWESQR